MSMFDESFSFGTGRAGSLDSSNSSTTSGDHLRRSVSPCSPTTAFPTSSFTVTDLAASFGRSRLRSEAQICYDSCAAYANTDDDAGWQLDPVPTTETDLQPISRVRTVPARPPSPLPSRRVHRQSSTRLLCSTAHHKDIAALVSRMVSRSEQCSVSAPDALLIASTTADNDDEGYDSSSDYFCDPSSAGSRRSSLAAQRARLQYRRSSDFKSSGACVNKAIRLRKDKYSLRRIEAQ